MTSTEFVREQRLLDLAIKLQLGTLTPQEQQEAADALSHTAGERLGLERKSDHLERRLEFIARILRTFWTTENEKLLFWRVDNNEPSFYVFCSDTFAWASADAEQITPENVHVLEQSIEDVHAVFTKDTAGVGWGFYLFCARVRGVRVMPQFKVPTELQEMFDACGPERVAG